MSADDIVDLLDEAEDLLATRAIPDDILVDIKRIRKVGVVKTQWVGTTARSASNSHPRPCFSTSWKDSGTAQATQKPTSR